MKYIIGLIMGITLVVLYIYRVTTTNITAWEYVGWLSLSLLFVLYFKYFNKISKK